jgi:hypothetical protein
MALKPISQKSFLKGINASVAYNAQPKGTLPRVSNLTYSNRGAMRSSDQNLGICTLDGTGPVTGAPPFLTAQSFQPTPTNRKILALQPTDMGALTAPTGLVTSDGGAGGTLAPATYYYVVTALDASGGETTASNEANFTVGGTPHEVVLTWTPVTGAVAYNVYRSTSTGTEVLLQGAGLPATAATYTDNGSATIVTASYVIVSATAVGTVIPPTPPYFPGLQYTTITFTLLTTPPTGTIGAFTVVGNSSSLLNAVYPGGAGAGDTITTAITGTAFSTSGTGGTLAISGTGGGINPPTTNQTTQLQLVDVSGLSYAIPANLIYTFPSGNIVPMPVFPVGSSGGSSSAPGGGTALNPSAGNIIGRTEVIPDMIPFVGLLILILGNGYPPYSTDGTTPNTIPLMNTFTGAFPNWIATTDYEVGDIIQPDTPNGHVYIATQGGISGTVEPTFPTGSGQTVTDHTVIWKENGSNTTPAPRGAAHAISHAGSLWLWNTYPEDTSDNLDGPSVLKMSDANNPNSWNPLNTAYVDKDDGQQGMGLASFTIAESGIPPEGSLVLFKEFATYQVIGVFGASDFAIQKAQTDLGCIAPRTIKFVPGYGIVRLSHLGVAVFDGVRDRLISEEIRPYLFGGQNDIVQMDQSYVYMAKADVVANPPMYVMAIPVIGNGNNGSLTRLCCFDLVLKAWTVIDLPFAIETLRQLNIPGGVPLTVFGGWQDSMISRWQVGDQQGWQAWLDPTLTIHQGTPQMWTFRTPAALGAEATDRVTFRRTVIRGLWQGTNTSGPGEPLIPTNSTGTAKFGVTITIDRANFAVAPARNLFTPTGGVGDSSFELVCEIGRTGLDAYATVSGTQMLGGAPVEIVEVDWLAIPRPVGALSRV